MTTPVPMQEIEVLIARWEPYCKHADLEKATMAEIIVRLLRRLAALTVPPAPLSVPSDEHDAELLLDLHEAEGYVSENPNVHRLASLCLKAAARIEALSENGPEVVRRDGTKCTMRQWAVEQKERAEKAEAELSRLRPDAALPESSDGTIR